MTPPGLKDANIAAIPVLGFAITANAISEQQIEDAATELTEQYNRSHNVVLRGLAPTDDALSSASDILNRMEGIADGPTPVKEAFFRTARQQKKVPMLLTYESAEQAKVILSYRSAVLDATDGKISLTRDYTLKQRQQYMARRKLGNKSPGASSYQQHPAESFLY